jgi:sporulation protein YlmC with PRC-barrel domain
MGAAIAPADSLEGARIVDADGAEVGVIEDLMLDARGGRVAYVVMSLAAPRDGQVVAVPWAALAHDGERRCFVLDAAFRYR